jgi:hypothetical protein
MKKIILDVQINYGNKTNLKIILYIYIDIYNILRLVYIVFINITFERDI